MKKFTQRVQRLTEKAAEVRHAIESVPPRMAEFRDAITTTTGRVQKLRADIVASVATLRAETDTQLVTTLREIDEETELLAEAGFHLEGVDMDLGPNRRLIVHLNRVENVESEKLRALLTANAHRAVAKAILSALLQADELADKVDLSNLTYTQLFIQIGAIPSVQVGWRPEPVQVEPAKSTSPVPELTPDNAARTAVAQGSFFALREPVRASSPGRPAAAFSKTNESSEVAQALDTISPSTPPDSAGGDWRRIALDRFKKMPDLGKRPPGPSSKIGS